MLDFLKSLFKKKPTVYITLEFISKKRAVSYPTYLPLPRIGESAGVGDMSGTVESISHFTMNGITNIFIRCS